MKSRSKRWVRLKAAQGIAQRFDVSLAYNNAGGTDDLRNLARVRANHGNTACHRFDEHAAKLFLPARRSETGSNQHVEAPHDSGHLRRADLPYKLDAILNLQVRARCSNMPRSGPLPMMRSRHSSVRPETASNNTPSPFASVSRPTKPIVNGR